MIINSSEPAKPSQPSTAVYQGCPYFGLADDPQTRLLFPIAGAVCHHARAESEVDIAYQQTTCLTAAHKACTVFLRPHGGVLPPEISGLDESRARSHRIFLGILVILGFAVVGIWIGLWWVNGSGRMTALAPTASLADNSNVALGVAATAVPTARPPDSPAPPTASPTVTPTPLPTDTPIPVDTPTPTLPPTFTPRAQTPTPLPTAVPVPQAVVNVPRLNVRQGPGTVYEAIGLIDEGAQFDIIGRTQDGSWLQICCITNAPGWVFAESVLVDGRLTAVPIIAADIPPTPTPGP